MNKVTYTLKDGRQVVVPYNRLGVAPVSRTLLEMFIKDIDNSYAERLQLIKCIDSLNDALQVVVDGGSKDEIISAYEKHSDELCKLSKLIKEGF